MDGGADLGRSRRLVARSHRLLHALPAILLLLLHGGCAAWREDRRTSEQATRPVSSPSVPFRFGTDFPDITRAGVRPSAKPESLLAATPASPVTALGPVPKQVPGPHDPAIRATSNEASPPPQQPEGPPALPDPGPATSAGDDQARLAPTPNAVPPPASEYPIDMTTALRLAEVENPIIAEARARIGEALALQQQARALLFPTLSAGTNYHGHTGDLQRSSGRILSLSEQSLYLGGGARTLAAESVGIPAVRIFSPLADAIFEPLVARQQVDVSRWNASATANTVLLEVATLFLELEGAEARVEAFRQVVAEAREVTRVNLAYARVGQRPQADAERSTTDLKLFEADLQRAEEEVAVASTRLVRRLHLDPGVRVRPQGDLNAPITLIDLDRGLPELIEIGLRNRPEIGATGAAIGVAQTRLREEKARPFLPIVSVGFSGGSLGGGSNLVKPLVGNFGSRTDFDVFAYWSLQNFGLGNLAIQRGRRAGVSQAEAEQGRVINLVRREASQALSLARAQFQQIDTARVELVSAEEGYREDLLRARGAVGRPIEVLDSLKLLAQARRNLIRAIVDYDQAQFALFVALGSPPPLANASRANTVQ